MAGLKNMFTGPPTPHMAEPATPPPDPDETGPLAQEAKRKRMQAARSRGGRASTILTGGGGTGGDYTAGMMG